jgi:hypothetical protein
MFAFILHFSYDIVNYWKSTNVSELSDIQVNTVHKMVSGESSNETEDEHLKQDITESSTGVALVMHFSSCEFWK